MRIDLARNVHTSWHIATACWGAIGGLCFALITPVPACAHAAWLVAAAVLLVTAAATKRRILLPVAFAAGLCLGLWRAAGVQGQLQAYKPFFGHTVEVAGTVAEDASIGTQGDQRLLLANVRLAGQPAVGGVWASIGRPADIKRGDTVVLGGQLAAGFGGVSASMYRAQFRSIIRPHPGDVARQVRDWFADGVRRAVREPQASLGLGYLTGQQSSLPQSLNDQLRTVGLTHAVVASGYNLTILVAVARNLLAGTSKYLATLAASGMIGGFMLVTGLSPSMSRAGLVSSLSLAVWYYGRSIHPFVLLPLAACMTALASPLYIWGDVGWYLSFAAFAGVVAVAPLLRTFLWGKAQVSTVQQIITDTFSAQLVTAPIILCAFGQFAVYALPANLLVLPFVPLAMLLTFLAGVGGLIVPGLAHLIGWPGQELLTYMTWVAGHVAAFPGARSTVHVTPVMLVVYYTLLLIAGGAVWRQTGHSFRPLPMYQTKA